MCGVVIKSERWSRGGRTGLVISIVTQQRPLLVAVAAHGSGMLIAAANDSEAWTSSNYEAYAAASPGRKTLLSPLRSPPYRGCPSHSGANRSTIPDSARAHYSPQEAAEAAQPVWHEHARALASLSSRPSGGTFRIV